MGLVLHPCPTNGVEGGVLSELREVDAAIEEFHHECVVKGSVVGLFLLAPPPHLARRLCWRVPWAARAKKQMLQFVMLL